MGKVFDGIDDRNAGFIRAQKVFFVATAPQTADGHVNLSPKGLEGLAILDAHTVAYLDLIGSGIETMAHVRENGRIALMFCAFEGPPRILRLHGRGEVVEPGDDDWDALASRFPTYPNARSVIRVEVTRIADSCGYGVPLYRFEGERDQLPRWAERKSPQQIVDYQEQNNRKSVDGLPGLSRKLSRARSSPSRPRRRRSRSRSPLEWRRASSGPASRAACATSWSCTRPPRWW